MFDFRAQDGVYFLSGRLDASQAERAERLLEGIQTSAVVDLGGLDYISSAGLTILARTQRRLRASAQALKLVNLQPRVRAVFHFASLEERFGIE